MKSFFFIPGQWKFHNLQIAFKWAVKKVLMSFQRTPYRLASTRGVNSQLLEYRY